jgi:hypothetical protein
MKETKLTKEINLTKATESIDLNKINKNIEQVTVDCKVMEVIKLK